MSKNRFKGFVRKYHSDFNLGVLCLSYVVIMITFASIYIPDVYGALLEIVELFKWNFEYDSNGGGDYVI